jgi:serine O-acetyltransferase
MSFIKIIRYDFNHYFSPLGEGSFFNFRAKHFLIAFLSIEYRLVLSYRIQNYLWTNDYRKLSYFLYLRSKWKYKCDIYPSAIIGLGLRVGHCSDIVIGPDCKIGKNATIFNGVTLGKRKIGENDQMPIIGDNVVVGTGAKLLGGIIVGDNVVIGANSVVNKNIENNTVVAGIPAVNLKSLPDSKSLVTFPL